MKITTKKPHGFKLGEKFVVKGIKGLRNLNGEYTVVSVSNRKTLVGKRVRLKKGVDNGSV